MTVLCLMAAAIGLGLSRMPVSFSVTLCVQTKEWYLEIKGFLAGAFLLFKRRWRITQEAAENGELCVSVQSGRKSTVLLPLSEAILAFPDTERKKRGRLYGLRVRRIRLDAAFGLPDAAMTAECFGIAGCVLSSVSALLKEKGIKSGFTILPDFSNVFLRASLNVSLRLSVYSLLAGLTAKTGKGKTALRREKLSHFHFGGTKKS